ncbi:MAG: hypothetical protein PHZ02_06210 [Desulfocapsaceae bacterium]|nr:hypothetical protein [Desulfocapsaceae bacterium]
MTIENNSKTPHTIKLPNRLFIFSLVVGLVTPFLARLAGVPFRGIEWLTAYLAGGMGILFLSAVNFIPSIAWFGLGRASKKFPLAYWVSISGGVAFLLYAHGSINLSSSSTAAIGLLFIPFYAVGAILASWLLGCILHFIIQNDKFRFWTAVGFGVMAVVDGVIAPAQQSRNIAARESRFPNLALSTIPLQKTNILTGENLVTVSAISYDNFQKSELKVFTVLSQSNILIINPVNYGVLLKLDYHQEDCDGCVHMYPYLVMDRDGSPLVSTSDGVSNKNGQIKWRWQASGFSRVVPIQSITQRPFFLSYQNTDFIVFHDTDGKELWRKNIPVSDIGIYVTPKGEQLPFAITGHNKSSKLSTYQLDGSQGQSIKIPDWAMDAQAISWPTPGNLLVGTGRHFAVLDQNGYEILSHTVQDTSFNPYHGPEGTSVKFSKEEKPYLAVMCHGSSGYARSVLFIFDPDGNLVWKEEVKKLSAIISLPQVEEGNEVLLVGGMEGIIEYKLNEERLTK